MIVVVVVVVAVAPSHVVPSFPSIDYENRTAMMVVMMIEDAMLTLE